MPKQLKLPLPQWGGRREGGAAFRGRSSIPGSKGPVVPQVKKA